MLAKAVQNGSYIHTCDIQQEFTQTELDRKLCVTSPKGISVKSTVSSPSPGGSNHRRVRLILLKVLYGLKQKPTSLVIGARQALRR